MPSNFNSPQLTDLARRRQHLRAKRRYNFYRTLWRSLAITGLAVGILGLARSPIWLIRDREQIEISGNKLLSPDNIADILPISYPQSLLTLKPEALAAALEKQDPIKDAVVSRRLIPPGLHVRVQERTPVATTLPDITHPMKTIPTHPVPFKEPGLIDAEGYWMPRNSFRELGANANPPALILRGMRPGYEKAWQEMYQQIAQSPITITGIDWTRPSNVILQTELGEVHIGPYSPKFTAQLQALDKLRSIQNQVNPEKIAFIDLQNPDNPVVEILQAANSQRLQ